MPSSSHEPAWPKGRREPHPSERSQRALDWLNFFVADAEVGFGPFISVYLSANDWQQGSIALMLTAGSVCDSASQLLGMDRGAGCGQSAVLKLHPIPGLLLNDGCLGLGW